MAQEVFVQEHLSIPLENRVFGWSIRSPPLGHINTLRISISSPFQYVAQFDLF